MYFAHISPSLSLTSPSISVRACLFLHMHPYVSHPLILHLIAILPVTSERRGAGSLSTQPITS